MGGGGGVGALSVCIASIEKLTRFGVDATYAIGFCENSRHHVTLILCSKHINLGEWL